MEQYIYKKKNDGGNIINHPYRVQQQREDHGTVHLQEEERWRQHHHPEEDPREASVGRQSHCRRGEPPGRVRVRQQAIHPESCSQVRQVCWLQLRGWTFHSRSLH